MMVRGVAPRNPLLFTNVDKIYKVRTQTHTSRKSYTGVAQAIVKAGKFHEILKAGLKLHCNYTVITLHL